MIEAVSRKSKMHKIGLCGSRVIMDFEANGKHSLDIESCSQMSERTISFADKYGKLISSLGEAIEKYKEDRFHCPYELFRPIWESLRAHPTYFGRFDVLLNMLVSLTHRRWTSLRVDSAAIYVTRFTVTDFVTYFDLASELHDKLCAMLHEHDQEF